MNVPQVFPSPQAVDYSSPSAVKRLGVIALATDLTSERDFARIIPLEKAGLHTTRVHYENPTTPENLRKMAPRLQAAADLILPGVALDAICFSCTSASVVIGDREVAAAINAARPGVPVVTPTSAARLALTALKAERIAVLTPYLVETSEPMAAYFHAHGFDIARFECFGLQDDRDMARITGKTLVEAVLRLDEPATEAFFISCTALQSAEVVAEIEARTGKAVITSNQASAWAMMRHAGLDEPVGGYGRLFELALPKRPVEVA
ncbi:MAG: ectoine utilization protein EutA [Dichotomicrobium sp.]